MSLLKILLLSMFVGLAACASDDAPGGDDVVGEDAPPFTDGVSTLTGHADPGFVDGPRGKARFANPVNVAYGPDGKLYVADFDNGKIRQVDATTGETSTIIAQTGFRRPFGMAFSRDGKLYVTTDNDPTGAHDSMSGTVWRINITAKTADVIAQKVGRPRGIAALADGRLAISDYQHHVIQIVDPNGGSVTPLAGTWDVKGAADGAGATASFNEPYGMAVMADGRLLVLDYGNHLLRVVGLDGSVTPFAGAGVSGFADGAMGTAKFDNPQGVAVASNGDIFISDRNNYRVRRIRGSTVETVAGSGEGGYIDADDKLAAEFFGLEGISLKPDGSMLFVADGGRGEDVPHNFIRSVKM